MDGTRSFGVDVTGLVSLALSERSALASPRKASRNRESGNKVAQAVLANTVLLREESLERSLQPQRGQSSRSAMAGSDNKDHLQIMIADEEVEMRPDEDNAWTCSPVAFGTLARHQSEQCLHTQQSWLDILCLQVPLK